MFGCHDLKQPDLRIVFVKYHVMLVGVINMNCLPSIPLSIFRFPLAPSEGHVVTTKDNEPQVIGPIPFEFMA